MPRPSDQVSGSIPSPPTVVPLVTQKIADNSNGRQRPPIIVILARAAHLIKRPTGALATHRAGLTWTTDHPARLSRARNGGAAREIRGPRSYSMAFFRAVPETHNAAPAEYIGRAALG
jgi:hypothetical protein